jgi:hypothetical protein
VNQKLQKFRSRERSRLNVYFLATKGNEPGAFNGSVQGASLTKAARASLINEGLLLIAPVNVIQRQAGSVQRRTATTYELGFKAGFLDEALSFTPNHATSAEPMGLPDNLSDRASGVNR